jgi:hypothetical protein
MWSRIEFPKILYNILFGDGYLIFLTIDNIPNFTHGIDNSLFFIDIFNFVNFIFIDDT